MSTPDGWLTNGELRQRIRNQIEVSEAMTAADPSRDFIVMRFHGLHGRKNKSRRSLVRISASQLGHRVPWIYCTIVQYIICTLISRTILYFIERRLFVIVCLSNEVLIVLKTYTKRSLRGDVGAIFVLDPQI